MSIFKQMSSIYALQVQVAMIAIEAQTVVAYRCLGMAGLWPSDAKERRRMVMEKPPAFAASGWAATQAMMQGKSPDQVARAAIIPLRRKTRANAKRLVGGG